METGGRLEVKGNKMQERYPRVVKVSGNPLKGHSFYAYYFGIYHLFN